MKYLIVTEDIYTHEHGRREVEIRHDWDLPQLLETLLNEDFRVIAAIRTDTAYIRLTETE